MREPIIIEPVIFVMKAKTLSAPTIEEFKVLLRNKNLKATPQRVAVHEAMLNLGHASADMVVEHIKARENGPSVTVASVYNTLTSLADLGIYQRRHSSNNKMYFDVNTFKHLHLYDSINNSFQDVIDDELIAYVESRLKQRKVKGFKIDSVDIQLICHPTRRKRAKL